MTAYFVYRPSGTEEDRGYIFLTLLWTRPFLTPIRDRMKEEVVPWLNERLGGGVHVNRFTGKTRKQPHRWAISYSGDIWISPYDGNIAMEFRFRWC